ncbi:MAG: polyprenyl synthetase family protein [Candidatus Cloacimonetes bacterium]|nr:polyprenyl synthetase family protein [Candidatus Cloacimonadota bacterium]
MLTSYFDTRIKLLDTAIKEYFRYEQEHPSRLFQAIKYSMFSGGKKIRPVLFFATFEMLKKNDEIENLKPLLPVAVAIESIHTASLIHDDLPALDNSNERRGQPSCHKKYDPATAILAGDALLTKAFELLSFYDDKEVAVNLVQLLCHAVSTRGMIGGQTVDLLSAHKNVLQLNVLQYIHAKKTGTLLEASVRMACACAKTDPSTTHMLATYAMNLGLAYQIIDDILDDVGDFETLGKEPYEDIRNHKTTYPTIMGLDKARKMADKLLDDSYKIVKNMKHNHILIEFLKMIKDRLP